MCVIRMCSINRPFYQYCSHMEFIRFKEYYGMPRGHLLSIYEGFSAPTYMYMQGCSYKKAKLAFLLHTSFFLSTAHEQFFHFLVLQSNLSQNKDLF